MTRFDSESVHIQGTTTIAALLGHPVAHSLSPRIHNALFNRFSLDMAYVPFDVERENLATAVASLRALGMAGANVTIPHKQAVIPLCDSVSDISTVIGAVNTLYLRDKQLIGTTTDPEGFFRALETSETTIDNRRIVVLGGGGTARTLAAAILLQKKPASLVLAGRNREKIKVLATELSAIAHQQIPAVSFFTPPFKSAMSSCDLLINCTSAGMHPDIENSPVPPELLSERMSVFDAVYNPAKTRLLRDAQQRGCPIQNGLKMLLFQAYASFKYWTGITVPDDAIDLNSLIR